MNAIDELLARPPEQRLREYKYRCAQAVVFGLPVVVLQYFGAALGGPEAPRYVVVLQALLAGWVIYVGAAGMLLEGWLRFERCRRVGGDFLIAVAAVLAYVASLVFAAALLIGRAGTLPFFHAPVILIAVWTGFRWARCLYSVRHPDPRGE